MKERIAITVASAVLCSLMSSGPAAATGLPTIAIGAPIGPLQRGVLGVNHRYDSDGFGIWRAGEGPSANALSVFRDAGFTSLRFPGGTIANTYHWRRGIGPVERRLPNVDGRDGTPVRNTFGSDEFGRFIEAAGTGGAIVVNFGSGDASEAADWVEYMNAPVGANPNGGTDWAAERARNGHPAPYGITQWEVGNEVHGRAQRYWMTYEISEGELARRYAFGGTSRLVDQPLATRTDHTDAAGTSDGTRDQVFFVRYAPVRPGSLSLEVEGRVWRQVRDLDAQSASLAYELDPATGRITFGDGRHGAIPPAGARITATYVSGPHDGFVDYYREMKRVDPTIRVGAALTSPEFIEAMGTRHPYDFLVRHFYTPAPTGWDNPAQLHDAMMLAAPAAADAVGELRRQLARATTSSPGIVMSEYGVQGTLNDRIPHYLLSLDHALHTVLQIDGMLKSGVEAAQKHTLTDHLFGAPPGAEIVGNPDYAMFGSGPDFVPTATALAFQLMTSSLGAERLAAATAGNPSRRIYDGRLLEALYPIASRTDDALFLLVVNRDLSSVRAQVRLPAGIDATVARVRTLTGPETTAYNSPERPQRVRIEEESVPVGSGTLTHTFPAHSLTAIEIEL